jgi:hypoxanthine phosphoribosyltransferase
MEEEFKVLIPREEIALMVGELSRKIADNHKGENILYFVTVLDGARRFSSDIKQRIFDDGTPPRVSILGYDIKLSSYGTGTETSGDIAVVKDIDGRLEGKDVVVLEDLIDTGLTLRFLMDHLLNNKKANSVELCCLLSKPSRRRVEVPITYLGREIPDEFIFGYGIDKGGKYRELEDICYIPKSSINQKI